MVNMSTEQHRYYRVIVHETFVQHYRISATSQREAEEKADALNFMSMGGGTTADATAEVIGVEPEEEEECDS